MKKKPIPQTSELFVGAYLGGLRIKAAIPLEQAAKDTRIRVQQLREIETDDFSGFVHPTYARLYLLDYASYLGVPLEEIRPMLPDRADIATGGFQYLNVLGTKDNMKPRIETNRPRNRLLILIVVLASIIIALVIGFSAYMFWRTMERVDTSNPIVKAATALAATPPASSETPAEPPAKPVADTEIPEGEAAMSLTVPQAPTVLAPAVTKPWPDVELAPSDSASPTPSPSPSPTPTPKPPRRRAR